MDKEVSAWDQNKRFFGTTDQPNQISKLLDMLKAQDKRIDKMEVDLKGMDRTTIRPTTKKR